MESTQNILKPKYYNVPTISDFKDMVSQSAEKYVNQIAFKLKDSTDKIYNVTYKKLKEDVWSFGTSLLHLDLAGKAISIMGKNSYSWIVSYIASSIVGTAVPIDKELHIDDILEFIKRSESKCIISDEKHLPSLEEMKKEMEKDMILINTNQDISCNLTLNFQDLLEKGSKLIENGDTSFDNIKINPDEMHIILFTSRNNWEFKRNLFVP